MDEANLKNILKEQREEYQRYLGVIAENFQSQTKLIAESLSGVQEQLVAIRDMVARNTEDIEMIRLNMEVVKTDIELIKSGLRKKVDYEEFAALEKRLTFLESKVGRK